MRKTRKEKLLSILQKGYITKQVLPADEKKEAQECFLYHMAMEDFYDLKLFQHLALKIKGSYKEMLDAYCFLYKTVRDGRFGMFLIKDIRELMLADIKSRTPEEWQDFCILAAWMLKAGFGGKNDKRRWLAESFAFFSTGRTLPGPGLHPDRTAEAFCRYLFLTKDIDRKLPDCPRRQMDDTVNACYPLLWGSTETPVLQNFLQECHRYAGGQIPWLARLLYWRPDIDWLNMIREDTPALTVQLICCKAQMDMDNTALLQEYNDICCRLRNFDLASDAIAEKLMESGKYSAWDIIKIYEQCRKNWRHLCPAAFARVLLETLLKKLADIEKKRT